MSGLDEQELSEQRGETASCRLRRSMFLLHEIYEKTVFAAGGVDDFCLTSEQVGQDKGLGKLVSDWAEHPDVAVAPPPDLTKVAIVGMHADGATYTSSVRAGSDQKSVIVCSMNFISARSARRRGQRHMVFVLSKRKLCNCGCSGFHAIQAFMKVFAWSMSFLAKSTWPSARHNDIPFTARERSCRMGRREHLRAAWRSCMAERRRRS